MVSVVGASGTNPDSAEDSDDMSQEGDDPGEREGIVMGKTGEELTRPSNLRFSLSVYLLVTVISVHFRDTLRGNTWRQGSLVRKDKTLSGIIVDWRERTVVLTLSF